ncbi:MAG TPA: phosphotransferase, partial [Candidatus Nanopelagicales bacterium]|nr:phosphotransferase [Candidatus Nanopelagicales bacterium]
CRYEATEDNRLVAIRRSAEQLIMHILSSRQNDAPDAIRPVWHIQEAVWPALTLPEFEHAKLNKFDLTLLPLSRIGQMEGKSGSLVLIGYFSVEYPERLYSHPLVIKTLDRSKSNKLRLEYDHALTIKPFTYDRKDNFAIPIFLDEQQSGYDILWSIYSATSAISEDGAAPISKVKDLREPIVRCDNEQVQHVMDNVFDLLKNCHRRFGRSSRKESALGNEYEWYLRGMWDESGGKWGQKWQDVWGTVDQKFIKSSIGMRINPLWVVEKLKPMERPMYMGAIHGDLHPGNVILRDRSSPAIIDFGWAQNCAHIAKDFVLLECNLRFLMLRTEVRTDELEDFASWVGWNSAPPDRLGEYLRERAGLIVQLRAKAAAVFPDDTNWDEEYLAPLFLVAMGLLRFAPQLGNQLMAIRFVEATANALADVFKWD